MDGNIRQVKRNLYNLKKEYTMSENQNDINTKLNNLKNLAVLLKNAAQNAIDDNETLSSKDFLDSINLIINKIDEIILKK